MNINSQKNNPLEEFYLVSSEYCRFAENAQDKTKLEFLMGSQKILSLIYLKASLLERNEELIAEDAEIFVQEADWVYIQNAVINKLGSSDKYIEIFLPDVPEPDNVETESLSDCYADIYQDLKDFVLNYEIDNSDSMLAGLNNCLYNFDKSWGPKLLAILVNIHVLIYSSHVFEDEIIDENTDEHSHNKTSTDNWLINKRFNQ